MKIIHCADVHLDSPLNRLDTTEKKKERKAELIKAFNDMVDYARREAAEVIIIAGDLFDRGKVSATTKNAVINAVTNNPQIDFYYLKGNHDNNNFLDEAAAVPANLHMFTDEWTTYDLGENITLTGVELTQENASHICSGLSLNLSHFNIVTLHGQESVATPKDKAQVININQLKNKGIDYLALGHVHSFKNVQLDARGTYCYPGCLEARGFDETGDHGFAVLDIDTAANSFSLTKISNPIRTAYAETVDISDCLNSSEILDRINACLVSKAYPSKDMVKVELVGEVSMDCEKNTSFIETQLKGRYYDFMLKDLTGFRVDYEKYRLDESLKGEFVRTVEAEDGISEADKAEIIRLGIRVLMGEAVE